MRLMERDEIIFRGIIICKAFDVIKVNVVVEFTIFSIYTLLKQSQHVNHFTSYMIIIGRPPLEMEFQSHYFLVFGAVLCNF